MRYLVSLLLFFFLLPAVASSASEKRTGGRRSSVRSVRKPQKLKIKPLVYNAKTHRPTVVKQKKPRRP